jgi:hypothetical protein
VDSLSKKTPLIAGNNLTLYLNKKCVMHFFPTQTKISPHLFAAKKQKMPSEYRTLVRKPTNN